MLKLLEARKAALEVTISERFRQARENGTAANVKQLSAILRAVKRQVVIARISGGSPEPGTCAVCGGTSWIS